jgi:uncharacterized Zn-finger protein
MTQQQPHTLHPTTPNDRLQYEVKRADLPLHCPLPGASLWDSHPRVFLPIAETGHEKCPYCGAEYTLVPS